MSAELCSPEKAESEALITEVRDRYLQNCEMLENDPGLRQLIRHTATRLEGYLPDGSLDVRKHENEQTTGSFKIRGAFFKMKALSQTQREHGVATVSAGNHIQGFLLAAHCFGVPAIGVLPACASPVKKAATHKLAERTGAKIIEHGDSFDEAKAFYEQLAGKEGYTPVPPFDDLDVIAGQATIAHEILADRPQTEVIAVAGGGGGLAAGVATAVDHHNRQHGTSTEVWMFEPEGAACITAALQAGEPVTLPRVATCAGGVAVARVGERPFAILAHYARQGLLKTGVVGEDDVQATLLRLQAEGTQVEGAAALAYAGASWFRPHQRRDVVTVLSGKNISAEELAALRSEQPPVAPRQLGRRATEICNGPTTQCPHASIHPDRN